MVLLVCWRYSKQWSLATNVAPIQEMQFLIQSSYLTHTAGVALLGHETVICLAGLKSSKFFGETSKKLRRNFEGTSKEL
jgi:hypothetical protein